MFRDKRTILATIILPVILYPLIFVGSSSLMNRQTAKMEEKGATIAILDSIDLPTSNLIRKELMKIKSFIYVPYANTSQKLYQDKEIGAIITLRDSLMSSGVYSYIVTIQYDRSRDEGKMIYDKIKIAMQGAEKELLLQRMQEKGLSSELLSPMRLVSQDTSSPQKKLGMFIGMLLPYMLIMLLIAGASVVATDLVAGEKERRTLETLLVSSAYRSEIVFGKYLTTITFALINVLINLISLFFSLKYTMGQSGVQMEGVKFPLQNFLLVLITLIPLATLYAAILLSISTFSRNMKETRTYEQPLLIISMLLAMVSFFPGFELTTGLALVPVVNFSLLFKSIMLGDYKLLHLALTVISTLILDVIAIAVTVRLFKTEGILFRTEVDTSLKAVLKHKKVFFSPFNGTLYFLIALVALFYLGSYMQHKNIVTGLFNTQILLIFLPVVLILRLIKSDLKATLRLNNPKLLNIILVPIMAVSSAILIAQLTQLINIIYPFPQEYLERVGKLLNIPNLSIWKTLALIAILPGICEELMFRGFLMRFFEAQGKWIGIIVTAVMFAIFHLDPFKFIPVLLLGLMLGWLLIKSNSIYVTMLFHAVNNAFALLLVHYSDVAFIKSALMKGENIRYAWAPSAIIVLILCLRIFNKINKDTNRKDICVE